MNYKEKNENERLPKVTTHTFWYLLLISIDFEQNKFRVYIIFYTTVCILNTKSTTRCV